MSSTYFEPEGSSSGRRLYMQERYNVFCMHQYKQCCKYEKHTITYLYTGCHRRNGPNFGRMFLLLNYTDITQNTYIQS